MKLQKRKKMNAYMGSITGLIILSVIFAVLMLRTTPVTADPTSTNLKIPNGVDLLRGAWGGTASLPESGEIIQVNLYFNESVPDLDDPDSYKAYGYFSWGELDNRKRAKAPKLPMMAKIIDLGEGIYDLSMLANVLISDISGEQTTTVMKLTCTVETFGPSVVDDHVTNGVWQTEELSGNWEAQHLDRRKIKALPVDLDDPTTDFWVGVDAHCGKRIGMDGQPSRNFILRITTNVVSAYGRADLSNGESLILMPTTDFWQPGIDFVNVFNFSHSFDMEPVPGLVTFYALDVTEQPIPNVTDVDIYFGTYEPLPPTNLQAGLDSSGGINVTWDYQPPIPGAFLDGNKGFYQLSVWSTADGQSMFGARFFQDPELLIPWNAPLGQNMLGFPLSEFPDGDYCINVIALSEAPEGSGGKNAECGVGDDRQSVCFVKNGDYIIIN